MQDAKAPLLGVRFVAGKKKQKKNAIEDITSLGFYGAAPVSMIKKGSKEDALSMPFDLPYQTLYYWPRHLPQTEESESITGMAEIHIDNVNLDHKLQEHDKAGILVSAPFIGRLPVPLKQSQSIEAEFLTLIRHQSMLKQRTSALLAKTLKRAMHQNSQLFGLANTLQRFATPYTRESGITEDLYRHIEQRR